MKLFYKCLPQKKYKSEEYVYEAVQHEDIESIRQWRNEQVDVLRQTHAIGREEQIEYFETLDSIFITISECEDGRNIDELLEGPVCHAGFEHLN